MDDAVTRRAVLTGGVSAVVATAVGVDAMVLLPEDMIFRVDGHIKWFDAAKGYGFIVPDNGLPDVLLTRGCLLKSGCEIAHEGAWVSAEVWQQPKGFVALNILTMGPESFGPPKPRFHTATSRPTIRV